MAGEEKRPLSQGPWKQRLEEELESPTGMREECRTEGAASAKS